MRIKQTFYDVQKGRLTTLEKITFLEEVTGSWDPVKLELLQKDLDRYIAGLQRQADIDAVEAFTSCLYEAFMDTRRDNPVLNSISQAQFWAYVQEHGRELSLNKDLMLRAVQIGKDTYKESYEEHFADSMELLGFRWMIEQKIRELCPKGNEHYGGACQTLKGGRQPTYELEDSRRWIQELRADPDYQHPNGRANIGAIDAELIARHRDKTGQKPSFATIKNHRRVLGFMQIEGLTRVNKG